MVPDNRVQVEQAIDDGLQRLFEVRMRLFMELKKAGPRDRFGERSARVLPGQTQEAGDLLREVAAFGVPHILAAGWLATPYFDPRPYPELMAVLGREHVDRPAPVAIPVACPPANWPA